MPACVVAAVLVVKADWPSTATAASPSLIVATS